MKNKKHIKNVMGAAIAISALIAGSANAAYTLTGSVAASYTQSDGFTFVNVLTATGNGIAFYNGSNSAIATIIDNAKRLNQNITINADDYGQITQVQ